MSDKGAAHVLIVEDEEDLRHYLTGVLRKKGYEVSQVGSAEEGLELLAERPVDLVITDIRLPGMTGLESLPRIHEIAPDAVVLVMTAYASKELAFKAIEAGAYDFFTKPFKTSEMEIVLERALERGRLERELRSLRDRIREHYDFGNIIGDSSKMQDVFAMARKVAPTSSTVLVTGESGTGKEMLAQAIHEASPRAGGPFVKLNCVAIPEHLLESELFGHEKGSFTGAHQRKLGKFELACGGTIFLDEIGDMSVATQAKILRVLQEREIDRIGGAAPIPVDVRVIAATNRDLVRAVREGTFREDLYFRLNVVSIYLPPLRERLEDLPTLAGHFVRKIAEREAMAAPELAPDVMPLLQRYDWPGNVRELQNTLERAVVLSEGRRVEASALPMHLHEDDGTGVEIPQRTDDLDATLARIERDLICDALERTDGVQAQAAELLGIKERSLWHRVKKLKIDVGAFKPRRAA